MKNYKARFIISIMAMVFSKIALVLIPTTFKTIIDKMGAFATAQNALESVLWMVILYGGLRITSSLFAEVRDTQFSKITQRALRELGLIVFDHLHNLSLRFHLDRQTGGIARVIERGTKSLETLMTFLTFNILPTFVEIILVGLFLSVMYDKLYAIVTLITMVLYILFTIKLTEWRITFVREMNRVETQGQTKAIDSLLNYETVKYFGNEKHEHNRFDEGLKIYEKAAVASRLSLAYLNIGQAVIISIGLILIMSMAVHSVYLKEMTIGDLIAVNAFLIQLTIPLFNLGFAYREIKLALVNIEDMFNLLQEPYEVTDQSDAHTLSKITTGIRFEDVSFSYDHDREILKNISFDIPNGHTIAVVGTSGAGKSTLSRLLFRFYNVSKGRITIDNTNIESITQQSLRKLIGIVPQDTVLFNDTIYYNIAYGNPNAPKEAIIEAAQKAQIYDFIQSLPQKFETLVGERGLKLSGGEKQRVAIARTLLKKPEFFIFDEATSALDTKTEKLIQSNLENISKNTTTLIIAHRLSTVTHAHQILVMEEGQIIERGTHESLLNAQGAYYTMWQRQQNEESENIPNSDHFS